jgi:hypothetical protein
MLNLKTVLFRKRTQRADLQESVKSSYSNKLVVRTNVFGDAKNGGLQHLGE